MLATALTLAACGAMVPTVREPPMPSATRITCSSVPGFFDATPLNLPSMEFPAGTVAQAPVTSSGDPGQYTIKTYQACAPNTGINLTVSTSKGPQPFTNLLQFYGWATWSKFPTGGDAQVACPGVCFAFNAYDPSKGLFQPSPNFLALDNVTSLGHGLVTFTLRLTTPPPTPDCGYMQSGGLPPISTWYDQSSGIQYPPLTRSEGDDTMSTTGSVQCSAGTVTSVKAFMDHQFATNGYVSDPCQAYDCWRKGSLVVSMQVTSATQWFIFTPRVLPTP